MVSHLDILAKATAEITATTGVRRCFFEMTSDEGLVLMCRFVVYSSVEKPMLSTGFMITTPQLEAMPIEIFGQKVRAAVDALKKEILS